MTGRNICNSRPVEIRGFQFVAESTCKYFEGVGFKMLPPAQLKPASSVGQPKGVPTTWSYCCRAICNCDGLTMESIPLSINGASETVPAMVIRYSRFVHTLKSPPGNTI